MIMNESYKPCLRWIFTFNLSHNICNRNCFIIFVRSTFNEQAPFILKKKSIIYLRRGHKKVWKALIQGLKVQKKWRNVRLPPLDANLCRQLPWTSTQNDPNKFLPIGWQKLVQPLKVAQTQFLEYIFCHLSFLLAHFHCMQLAYVVSNSLDSILY